MADRLAALRHRLTELIPKGKPIVLEIGCGHGHFLTAYGRVHPGDRCIGIDIASERLERAEKKRERSRLDNVAFVRAAAADFLAVLPDGVTLARVFILFPDPWPKRRHHKNRLLTARFLGQLAQVSEPGALLCFRTDYAPYFDEVAALVSEQTLWKLLPTPALPFEEPTVFQLRAQAHFTLVALRT